MQAPDVDFVSNLTGRLFEGPPSAGYWGQHARNTVRFADGLATLQGLGYRMFLEVGPRPTLTALVTQSPAAAGCEVASSLRPGQDDWRQVCEALAALHVHGVPIDWRSVDRGFDHRLVRLPTYAFVRERCWFAPTVAPAVSRRPAWPRCVEATRRQSMVAPFDLVPASFPAKWAALGRLTAGYQLQALRELGVFLKGGEVLTPAELCARTGIAPTYVRLIRRWLEHLSNDGHLTKDGDRFRAAAPLSVPDLDALRAEAQQVAHDYPEFLAYVESCGPRLARVLTGRESPLETLFPQGSFDLADGLYNKSAVQRYLNEMVCAAVDAQQRSLPSDVSLRILEIGAGTGGTTAALLPRLDPERTEYTFTDVSDAFFHRAQDRLRAHRLVKYVRFDVDRDAADQGMSTGGFDVIVAANVLHATRDLDTTLSRVASLLAPGGLLVLSETTAHPTVFDITTGLIEGWQVFDDPLRADNPLVDASTWVRLLRANGFEHAAAFPEPDSAASSLGNHIVIAAKAGEVTGARQTAAVEAGASDPQVVVAEAASVAPRETWDRFLPEDRRRRLAEVAREEVMGVLRLDAAHAPQLRDRLIDLGLDSLMVVQLRNRLERRLDVKGQVPATLVFDAPTCEAIGAFFSRLLVPETSGEEPPAEPVRPEVASGIAGLSDEEAEALLLKRLDSIEEPGR